MIINQIFPNRDQHRYAFDPANCGPPYIGSMEESRLPLKRKSSKREEKGRKY